MTAAAVRKRFFCSSRGVFQARAPLYINSLLLSKHDHLYTIIEIQDIDICTAVAVYFVTLLNI